tara:strand:+ start:323 stop:637 length:315 start_codon:yes stop_codon:yes gene_type:complete
MRKMEDPKWKKFSKDLSDMLAEREDQYGTAKDRFNKIAEAWSWYLKAKNKADSDLIKGEDIPALMMLFKITRMTTAMSKKNLNDSLLDLAGYASLLYEDNEDND